MVVTDKYPVDLHYVPHLDQVWVLNWRSENNTGIKTIQVIRDAGQKRKHHTVHPEPIDGQFDLVKGLYIPAANQELSHFSFKYGYVTHTNQRGLYKLDLSNLRYTKSVDLTPYNCVPAHIQFSALCKLLFRYNSFFVWVLWNMVLCFGGYSSDVIRKFKLQKIALRLMTYAPSNRPWRGIFMI